MAKRNNQKGPTTASADQSLSWSQYWSWFTSNIIGDGERKETFLYFLKSEVFEGMTDAAKMEVLEFAPDYILNYLVKVKQISQEFVDRLKSNNGQPAEASGVRPLTYKELVALYKR